MFGIETWKNMIREYHENEEQYLDVLSCDFFVVQNTCNLMMYSATYINIILLSLKKNQQAIREKTTIFLDETTIMKPTPTCLGLKS
jgi:hypothetical protein